MSYLFHVWRIKIQWWNDLSKITQQVEMVMQISGMWENCSLRRWPKGDGNCGGRRESKKRRGREAYWEVGQLKGFTKIKGSWILVAAQLMRKKIKSLCLKVKWRTMAKLWRLLSNADVVPYMERRGEYSGLSALSIPLLGLEVRVKEWLIKPVCHWV